MPKVIAEDFSISPWSPSFKSLQNPWASVSGQREFFKSILRLSCPSCENQLALVKAEPRYVLNNEKGQLHTSNFLCPYKDEWGLWIFFHCSMESPLASILKVARHARRLTQKTLWSGRKIIPLHTSDIHDSLRLVCSHQTVKTNTSQTHSRTQLPLRLCCLDKNGSGWWYLINFKDPASSSDNALQKQQ